MKLKVVIFTIVLIPFFVEIVVPRIRPALLLALNVRLQRGEVVRQPLLLRLIEYAYLAELTVEQREAERVRVAYVHTRGSSGHKRRTFVRLEVMVRLLEAGLLLLELVDVLLQRFVTSRRSCQSSCAWRQD